MRRGLIYILSLFLSIQVFAQKNKDLKIVYIGNSITQGALIEAPEVNAPPAQASQKIKEANVFKSVSFSNQGVSGNTTVDFLPISNKDFKNIVIAAEPFAKEKNGLLVFSIMLGTNDSAISGPTGAPVSNKQYATNMKAIIDELIYLYPKAKFILHRPLWYSPNTYNYGMYLEAGLKRVESYASELEDLVELYKTRKPNQVFLGDTLAFNYFKTNFLDLFTPESGNAGIFYLHPNKKGAESLAQFWSNAILNAAKTF